MPAHRHHPVCPSRILRRRSSPSPPLARKSAAWTHQNRRQMRLKPEPRPIPPMARESCCPCATPLSDRVATTFHAGTIGPVEGVDFLLLLSLGLLVLGLLVLPSPAASGHGPDDRADGRTLARIARYPADDGATRRAAQRPARTFAPAHGRARRLRRRRLRDDGGIDAGVLLGPHIALA